MSKEENIKADIGIKSNAETPSAASAAAAAPNADKSTGSSGGSANSASSADSEVSASEAQSASNASSASTKRASLDEKMAASLNESINRLKQHGKQQLTPKRRKPKSLTHGVYSDDLVLPWENAADYDKLYEEFKQEWRPEGRSEEETVFDLAHLTWLKRRAQKMSQLTYHRHPFAAEAPNAVTSWSDIVSLQRLRTTYATDALAATATAITAMEVVATAIRDIPHDFSTAPGKEAQQAMFRLGHLLRDGISSLEKSIPSRIKPLSDQVSEAVKTFDLAYDPSLIDREVRTVAAIEARIDKLLQRLNWLKEYKQTVASRALPQVASPTIAQG